jgi:hypothetical protein
MQSAHVPGAREENKLDESSAVLKVLTLLLCRWVTQITTNPKYPEMILSASRDKSLIVWKLTRDDSGEYMENIVFNGCKNKCSGTVTSCLIGTETVLKWND